ncbi:MAG: RHS repeat-associated core domain-containing protein, partial [Candidatus Nomurabacteria bacterium]
FGMLTPGRKFSAGTAYRYGFNGKENDKDINSGAQDYGMRIYDGRLGKFLSIDPLTKEYPWYTTYQFAGNKPIWCDDLDGKEERIKSVFLGADGNKHPVEIFNITQGDISETITLQRTMAMTYGQQKSSGYEWIGGYNSYFSGGHPENNPDWHGPSKGTLTIDATGNVAKISYSSTNEGLKQRSVPFSKSISLGAQAFVAFFISPDKSVEGSAACINTVHNYFSIFMGAFAAPEALAGNYVQIANMASLGDDMAGGENGSFSSQHITNKTAKAIVSGLKVISGFASRGVDITTLSKNINSGTKTVKNAAIVLKETYDVTKQTVEATKTIKEAIEK